MSECRVVRSLLRESQLPDLPAELQGAVADHLSECPQCLEAFETSVLLDTAIASGLKTVPAPASVRHRPWRVKPLRFAGIAVGGFAGLAFAAWLGAPIIRHWLLPGSGAAPIRPAFALLGLPDVITSNTVATPNEIGPWRVVGDLTKGFASLDDRVSYSGSRSIKLVQRSGSGELRQEIPIPLPAGTQITFGVWILSPRGGSADNKYFAMALQPAGSQADAWTYVFDGSPNWRPYIVRETLAQAAPSFSATLSVSGGNGNYRGWDWATWVDDVFVGVMIPIKGASKQVGDRLVVDAQLPPGYTPSMIEPDSIRFNGYDPRIHDIPGRLQRATHGFQLVFDSPAALRAMQTANADTGAAPVAWIAGRLRYHRYSIPFEVHLVGYVSPR